MKICKLLLLFLHITTLSGCRQLDGSVYTKPPISTPNDKTTSYSQLPAVREKRQKFHKGLVYVTKVIDGDTFWVDDGTKEIKVRFIGIDAPEIRNTRHKKKGSFAQEAKVYVTQLTEHQWVRLELDVQKIDPFKRLLAHVYLEDGTFLNAHLVANGYAVVDTHPPNVKYADLFIKLQQDARLQKLGLWAE